MTPLRTCSVYRTFTALDKQDPCSIKYDHFKNNSDRDDARECVRTRARECACMYMCVCMCVSRFMNLCLFFYHLFIHKSNVQDIRLKDNSVQTKRSYYSTLVPRAHAF